MLAIESIAQSRRDIDFFRLQDDLDWPGFCNDAIFKNRNIHILAICCPNIIKDSQLPYTEKRDLHIRLPKPQGYWVVNQVKTLENATTYFQDIGITPIIHLSVSNVEPYLYSLQEELINSDYETLATCYGIDSKHIRFKQALLFKILKNDLLWKSRRDEIDTIIHAHMTMLQKQIAHKFGISCETFDHLQTVSEIIDPNNEEITLRNEQLTTLIGVLQQLPEYFIRSSSSVMQALYFVDLLLLARKWQHQGPLVWLNMQDQLYSTHKTHTDLIDELIEHYSKSIDYPLIRSITLNDTSK